MTARLHESVDQWLKTIPKPTLLQWIIRLQKHRLRNRESGTPFEIPSQSSLFRRPS